MNKNLVTLSKGIYKERHVQGILLVHSDWSSWSI